MKPTPGPWEAKRSLANYRRWRIQSSDVNKSAIAETAFWRVSDPSKEEEANAYLLAASWDLYDGCNALLELLRLIRDRDDVSHELAEIIRTSNRVNEAEQAVAKTQKGEG